MSLLDRLDQPFARRRLAKCLNVMDLRKYAKRRIPPPMFTYLDAGAESETTLRRNGDCFGDYQLVPRYLVDVSTVDLSTSVMGTDISMPLMVSPTAMIRLFHHQGEKAVAAAAGRSDTVYTMSTMATHSLEEVSAASNGPKWFQMYVLRNREMVKSLFDRAREAGFEVMCLTVDLPVAGNRERDARMGLTVPPKPSMRTIFDIARTPYWVYHLLTEAPIKLPVVEQYADKERLGTKHIVEFLGSEIDDSLTWEDAAWMAKEWGGPFAIKGLLAPDDARRAVDAGASGIIVSNHGGRQLDHAPAPLDALPEIVEAVRGRADIILDGGIRRGTDVMKALALGAKACMTGRPFLYGLGAGGEAGVFRALELFRSELKRDMILTGCQTIADIGPEHVRRVRG